MRYADGTLHANACGLESEGEQCVSRAAGYLDISEFRLFEIAFAFWFGRPAAPDALDNAFWEYVQHGTVPFWTRSFLRSLEQSTNEEGCTVSLVEIERPKLTLRQKLRGSAIIAAVIAVLLLFIYIFLNFVPYDL